MYEDSRGVMQNLLMVHLWSTRAAMIDKDATRNQDIAAAKLTPEQIAERKDCANGNRKPARR
jgi:hypothetical protein